MEILKYKGVPSIGVLKTIFYLLFVQWLKVFSKFTILLVFDTFFQLSLSLSPLKGHKWRYNFNDTLSGICHCSHDIEDTSQFLFSHAFSRDS